MSYVKEKVKDFEYVICDEFLIKRKMLLKFKNWIFCN